MITDCPRAPSHVAVPAQTRAPASSGARLASSIESPAALTSTSRSTRVANESASSAATKPPIELPTTTALSTPSERSRASRIRA